MPDQGQSGPLIDGPLVPDQAHMRDTSGSPDWPLAYDVSPPPPDLALAGDSGCTPEICNGLDDDCDGAVDEPVEADADCRLRLVNAATHCEVGQCMLDGCLPGFAECDGVPSNGCEPAPTYFADSDGDGAGAPGAPLTACSQPPGYVSNSADCYDGNPFAVPGQTSFFEVHRGDGSFDYNCDGQQTKEHPKATVGFLLCFGSQCSFSEGWKGQVPDCGEQGQWVSKCTAKPCVTITESRIQRCR